MCSKNRSKMKNSNSEQKQKILATRKLGEEMAAASVADDLGKMNLGDGDKGVPCTACGKEKASKKCKKRHARCAKESLSRYVPASTMYPQRKRSQIMVTNSTN